MHVPGKVVLGLAPTLALGGDCLAGVAVLRAEPGVYGSVASDPTVSRTITALAADALAVLAAIIVALAAAQARVWTPAYGCDGGIREGAWVAELTGILNLTGGRRTCGSSPARSAPTPGRSYRSSTPTV